MDKTFKLAHIAWPGLVLQPTQGTGREVFVWLFLVLAMLLQEMFCKQDDVVTALA